MRTLLLLVGPTCTGKSTLEKELNKRGVPSITSYTTRTIRTGETDGVDYQFLTRDGVEALERAGQIVQKVEYAGNYYGSTQDAFDKAYAVSNTAVIVVEPTGVTQFQEYAARVGNLRVVSVYINNRLQTLIPRLVARYHADTNGDPAYYWNRLVNLMRDIHEWPLYSDDWTIFLDQMDNGLAGETVQDTADFILAYLPARNV